MDTVLSIIDEWDWDCQPPWELIQALADAGYVIVPKEATIRMGRAGAERLQTSTYATDAQRMGDAWQAMIGAYQWCDTCEGRGYVVMDAEWDAYAVQCPRCADRRPARADGEQRDKTDG